MPATDSSLTLGSPRFSDARLAALANTQGTQAAWREAVAKDASKAATGVTGEFAVGLRESDGRTFLAVDSFAINTLCYRIEGGQLRFAIRADELADADTPVDPQAIFDYLFFHVIPSPRTIYKGIYRLPPGHYALFENGLGVNLCTVVGQFIRAGGKPQLPVGHPVTQAANGEAVHRRKAAPARLVQADGKVTRHAQRCTRDVLGNRFAPG